MLGHVWRGMREARLVPPDQLFTAIDSAIYSFHMPLFFLLAGLVLERTLLRLSPAAYVTSRVVRLLYPMVVWTYLFGFFRWGVGGLANVPMDLTQVLAWPLPPKAHLWFLWALFVIQVGALALRPALLRGANGFNLWLLALPVAVALSLLSQVTLEGAWPVRQALRHLPFVVLGVLIARAGLPRAVTEAAPLAFGAFVVAVMFALAFPGRPGVWLVSAAAASMAVCVMAGAAVRWPPAAATVAALGYLGRVSMPIFLAHTIFAAAARIVLVRHGFVGVGTHLVLGTAAGIAGPVALWLAARRLRLSRALGF